ncbi:MAG: GNAT family N-acetyltransferase [Pleurocapsa sp. SU_5_0]|nr:GNAT family N-acetyltransferase [Pleurocapsa sp. SU_5_0]NJR47186.1 GNAT family N-acetyltransferase [Hyellaceae cyanobacterium CSU_1_1]
MKTDTNIRVVTPNDLPDLKVVIEANDLFPSDMLDEMISGYFNQKSESEYWFTYEDSKPVAIAYCGLERMTEGTWNLYLIAVHPDYQGQGLGTSMLHYIEQMLTARGERVMLVETSSLGTFEGTREFYRKCGYDEEARIREFYQAGEDKIVFRKSLTDRK